MGRKRDTSYTNTQGQRKAFQRLALKINDLRNILLLLLPLWIAHLTYVEADEARSERTVFHVILNYSRQHLSEFPNVGPEVVREDVEVFYLERNRISKITAESLAGYDNLEELHLRKNSLRYLENGTFRKVPSLKILDIQWNKIMAIESGAFSGLENLEKIFLDHNKIDFLPDGIFANLAKLKVVNLKSNPLRVRSLSKNTFRNLTSLKTIDMSGTLLTKLPNDLFQDCRNLQNVYLRKTLLISVNMVHWPSAPYVIVDLQYSPLVNITNVPKELTTLKASFGELKCTCENKRAILLVVNTLNITSPCQNFNCNSPKEESVARVVAQHHMSPDGVSLGVTCSTSESVYNQMNKQLYLLLIICCTLPLFVARH